MRKLPEMNLVHTTKLFLLTGFLLATSMTSAVWGQAELAEDASWSIPNQAKVESVITQWLDAIDANEETRTAIQQSLTEQGELQKPINIDQVVQLMSTVHAQLNPLLEVVKQDQHDSVLLELDQLATAQDLEKVVTQHAALLVLRWLSQRELYDEALEVVAEHSLTVGDVLDPATLLFYRGIAEHQLLKRDESVATLELLLENEDELPSRFSILARLMTADISQMEEDSLDEVARLMSDIKRRQKLYRSGKRVRDEEGEVIAKLDSIIEELEQQQQQQQQQQSSSAQNSTPAEQSQIQGGMGDGEVKKRTESIAGQWGELPPAQREAALAEMAKDFPPHYREVIEEYFRKLAQSEEGQ